MRARAAAILDRAKLFDALLWMRARVPLARRLPVLNYHSITTRSADYPFDPDVVDATPEQFDAQMAFIARHFQTVGMAELRASRSGGSLPPNGIVITFDDGYKNNIDVAVPILKKHGLTATFFVATHFIAERRIFWWDQITYLVSRSTREQLTLSYPYELSFDLRTEKTAAIHTLFRLVKETYGMDVERLLDAVRVAADVPWDRALERKFADEMVLTWDDVRALRDAGMEVHSHTHRHRVLTTLSDAEAKRELLESRQALERELGVQVWAVSYPCGRSIESDPELCTDVREAGYELGFSTERGNNGANDSKARPLHLHRVTFETTTPMSLFRGILAFPFLAP